MASRVSPSFVNRHPSYGHRWRARRVRGGVEYFLGYYAFRSEAEAAERRFDRAAPSQRGKHLRVVR